MHIDVVPNRTSRPAYLLRESYRDGKKVKKRTIANLSSLTEEQITAFRAILSGQKLAPVDTLFTIEHSRAHGHVDAVSVAMSRLKIPGLLSTRPSRERDLVCALIAARIVAPHTKLATTRWWHTTTLAQDFGVADATEDELYAAMDWLLARQDRIQKKLAARHLHEDSLVLYDLSSSYFEGTTCPLARLGYSRDGKRGKLQVNYGLLTDARGCPVSVSVYAGNTTDPQTLMPEIDRVRNAFGIDRMVMVGVIFHPKGATRFRVNGATLSSHFRARTGFIICYFSPQDQVGHPWVLVSDSFSRRAPRDRRHGVAGPG